MRPTATGKIELVVHREEQTAGIRFLFAEEIVAVALQQMLGPGQHTDEELGAYLNGLFTVLMKGVNEAVKIGHTIAIVFVEPISQRITGPSLNIHRNVSRA